MKRWRGGCVALIAGGMAFLAGCAYPIATGPYTPTGEVSPQSYRSNMAPELKSITMTPEQRLNNRAFSKNLTFRQIYDDWDAFWLRDRPLRLSESPIP